MSIPRILLSADWHLGHPRTPTEDTVKDIRKHLFPELIKADVFFLAGDIYDLLISLSSDTATIVIELFVDIIRLCYEHDVVFRIIRGTFTHDHFQANIIERLYKKLQLPINFRLFNDLAIERIDKYDMNVLYMPDNLPYKNKNDILDHVKRIMIATNTPKVDYVVCHTEFDHMSFGFINSNAYSTDDFDDICSGLILSGHIHKPHRHKNLIYAGSINRLAHNEEESKGFWIIEGSTSRFIRNDDATRFITIDYRKESEFDVMLKKHIELLKTFDNDRKGFLRVLITDTNLRNALSSYHDTNHPNIRLSFKQTHTRDNNVEYLVDKLKRRNTVTLEIPSLKNIAAIVCDHLLSQGVSMDITDAEFIINGG